MTDEIFRWAINNGFAVVVVAFIGAFLDRRAWTWFTTTYWPKRVEQQEEEVKTMKLIAETLISLRVLSETAAQYHAINTERLIRVDEVMGLIFEQQKHLNETVLTSKSSRRSKLSAVDR